jgi:hypothetical protein
MGTPVVLGDRVLVTTTTTGTGTYQLGSAVTGFLTPALAGISTGARMPFVVVDSLTAPTAFEVGEGTYTSGSPATLARTQIRRNTSGGTSAINWGAGTKYILLAPSAANLPAYDTNGLLAAATATAGTNDTTLATTAFVQTAVAAKAPIANPTFTGTPAAPTAAGATNTTQLATTAFVQQEITAKAPLANPTFTGTPAAPTAAGATNTTQLATTAFVQQEIAPKAPLANPTFTGTPAAPTAAGATSTTQLATTAFVQQEITPKAPLASPTLTGTPAAPTAAANTNTTQLATTAFVRAQIPAEFTGANQSFAATGYQKLPGGLILQWTNITIGSGGSTWTFPTAFPTACYFVGGNPAGASVAFADTLWVGTLSASQVSLDFLNTNINNAYVFALGR